MIEAPADIRIARGARPATAADVAAFHRSLDPAETAGAIARVFCEVAGAAACGVWLLDGDDLSPVAGAVAAPTGEPEPVDGFADRPAPAAPGGWKTLLARRATLSHDAQDLELVPPVRLAGAPRAVLVPLLHEDRPRGLAALAPVDPDAPLEALEELGTAAATALAHSLAFERRGSLLAGLERQVERLDVLHDLSGALTERGGSSSLVARLNRLLDGRGPEVESLAWRSRSLAQRLGGSDLTPEERAMLRDSGSCTTLPDGRIAIPMHLGRRSVGTMRVRGATSRPEEVAFLEILAAGVAEVANRISTRADMEEAARGRELAQERDRIAADLHDTAGQLFVAIQLLARREAEKLSPDSHWAERFRRLAELADQGKWEIDQAIDALAFFPAARRGLVPAIKSLATSFGADSGLDVIVDVTGRPARLPAKAERALYRVVHESLANAWRHARCSVVRVALSFDKANVVLSVTDDGMGLTASIPDRGRVGTNSMRRAITDVGGTFRIRNARPRGVVVEAEIPRERR
ncbi:MAG TPA: GAF domain-containing protein [Actinomycetota bacterium]|nr:GAF domain-containing protein [Actinomycetota bacterium]